MREIDARGSTCPAPVIQTKAVCEKEGTTAVRVIVDNQAAQQNVCRFLESRGFRTSVDQNGDEFHIIGTREAAARPDAQADPQPSSDVKKIMVMVATDRMGYGDDALGMKLMVNFLTTLKEMGRELWRLVFVNNGVKLTAEGSEVLPVLQNFEREGRKILVCGTCLNHFNLLAKKQVGETTNMLDIVTAMQLADKVITI